MSGYVVGPNRNSPAVLLNYLKTHQVIGMDTPCLVESSKIASVRIRDTVEEWVGWLLSPTLQLWVQIESWDIPLPFHGLMWV